MTFDVDLDKGTGLPPGWKLENGFMQLEEVQDEWRINGN